MCDAHVMTGYVPRRDGYRGHYTATVKQRKCKHVYLSNPDWYGIRCCIHCDKTDPKEITR